MADYEARIAICQQCPKYMKIARLCGVCGCFMPVKGRLDSQRCPLGKWETTKLPPEKPEDIRR